MVDFDRRVVREIEIMDPDYTYNHEHILHNVEDNEPAEYKLYPVEPGQDNPRYHAKGNPVALIQHESRSWYHHPKFIFAKVTLNHMFSYRHVYKQIIKHFDNLVQLPTYHRERFYVTSTYVQKVGKVLLQSEEYYPNDRSMADDWAMAELSELKVYYNRDQKRLHNMLVRRYNK
jgi:hypothetical protein